MAIPNAHSYLTFFSAPSLANGRKSMEGRFLAATAERRRSGAGTVPEEDRWLPAERDPPRRELATLAWARRASETPSTPRISRWLSTSSPPRLECVPKASVPDAALQVHGLALTPASLSGRACTTLGVFDPDVAGRGETSCSCAVFPSG